MASPADQATRRKKNVKVFTRILPSVDFSHDNIKVDPSSTIINVRCLQDFLKGVTSSSQSQHANFWSFTTDGVYYNASQEEIYSAVMRDIADKLLSGSNVILLCYGQTGSGKSFTVNGLRNRYEHRGLAPRLLGELFEQKCKQDEDAIIRYKMSYVELVGREMRDLLDGASTTDKRVTYQRVTKNALALDVSSEEEGLKVMFEGESRRHTCEGAPYAGANMGHSILTIHVENTSQLISQASRVTAKVHMLDMAGIDTAGKPTCTWKMPRDIGKANITKSILQQFLTHLDSSEDERLSPVIGYLGKSLSTETTLRLVGHIRASERDLDITLSTLRLGETVSGMRANKVKLSTARKQDLKLQTRAADVAWLRGRVELAAMLENQTDWMQTNLPPYRMKQLHDLAHSYINNDVGEIQVKSVMENVVVMQDFKEAYARMKQAKEELDQKLAALAEEAELAREKALLESKDKSTSSKLSKGSSSNTSSLGRTRGKKLSSKALEYVKEPLEEEAPPLTPPPPLLVGELKSKGITIGPGFMSDYQGEATKASKRDINVHQQQQQQQHKFQVSTIEHDKLTIPDDKKASSSLSLREQFRCAQEFSSDSESESRHPLWTPPHPVLPPAHEEAWEEFLASSCPYATEVRANIERGRQEAEAAYKKHVQTCTEMKEMAATLSRVLHELLNEQHQRHLSGKEEYDVDGRIVVGEIERNLVAQSKQLEMDMTSRRETLLQGLSELNESVARLNDAKKKLEENFEEFRAQNLKISPTEVELRNKQLEITARQDPVAEQRSKHYQSLQQLHFSTNDCKLPALS